jgi:hypothetical protein
MTAARPRQPDLQRRALVAGLAAALAAPAPAFAAVTRVPLGDAFLLLEAYLALKPLERDRFRFAYRALRNGKPAPDAKVRIVHRDRTSTPLAFDADGWVTTLPTLDEIKRRDSFEVDGPPLDFALELRATMTPADRLPVRELTGTLAQVNAAIVSFAGNDAGAVSRLTCIYFPDAGAGRAILESGEERPLKSFDFKLIGPTPYFEPRATPHATSIALARAPSRILLAGPPR